MIITFRLGVPLLLFPRMLHSEELTPFTSVALTIATMMMERFVRITYENMQAKNMRAPRIARRGIRSTNKEDSVFVFYFYFSFMIIIIFCLIVASNISD
jgi:hypothetical protein